MLKFILNQEAEESLPSTEVEDLKKVFLLKFLGVEIVEALETDENHAHIHLLRSTLMVS